MMDAVGTRIFAFAKRKRGPQSLEISKYRENTPRQALAALAERRLVGWSVGPLVGLVMLSIGQSVGRSNGWSVGPSIGWLVNGSVSRSVNWSVSQFG